jgi:hypothetical protein
MVAPACVDYGPRRLCPVATSIELCTNAYEIYGDPTNLVAWHSLSWMISYLASRVNIGSVQVTHGLPIEVFARKTALGRGRTRLDYLIVNANGGHSWYLCGSPMSCCQVIFLASWLLIQISATPSDMGDACSLCTNVKLLFHHVHMRFMVIFNYGYLVVENDDTKNGWLSYHACLA